MTKRCHQCSGRFGLVRYRWVGYQFCRKSCLNDFLTKRARELADFKRWIAVTARGSPSSG
jgi:hypothetical protein